LPTPHGSGVRQAGLEKENNKKYHRAICDPFVLRFLISHLHSVGHEDSAKAFLPLAAPTNQNKNLTNCPPTPPRDQWQSNPFILNFNHERNWPTPDGDN
jgi:hypothetical protein